MDWLRVNCETQGFFTRAQARDLGYGDREMARAVRSGEWKRIRRGYYTYGDIWAGMDEVERHRVRAHAVLDSLGPSVALSHVSGAVEHGIATWGIPLATCPRDPARRGKRSDRGGRGSPHRSEPRRGRDGGRRTPRDGAGAVRSRDGHSRHARVGARLPRLAPGSSASRRPTGLFARFETMERWPSTRHLHIPVRMADAGAQSPGESRGRWLFRQGGLPAPRDAVRGLRRDGAAGRDL